MKKTFFLFILLNVSLTIIAQSPKRILKKLGQDPLYFIDSVNVDKSEVLKYDSKDIGLISVIKKENAIKLLGEDGKDGAIYIETKIFVKSRYWKFFLFEI